MRKYEAIQRKQERNRAFAELREELRVLSNRISVWCHSNGQEGGLMSEIRRAFGLDQATCLADKPHYIYATANPAEDVVRFTLKGRAVPICYISNDEPLTLRMVADMVSARMIPLREKKFYPLFNYSPAMADAFLAEPRLAPLVELIDEMLAAMKRGNLLDNEERRQRAEAKLSLRNLRGQMEDNLLLFDKKIDIALECIAEATERMEKSAITQMERLVQVAAEQFGKVLAAVLAGRMPVDPIQPDAVPTKIPAPARIPAEDVWTVRSRIAEKAKADAVAKVAAVNAAAAEAAALEAAGLNDEEPEEKPWTVERIRKELAELNACHARLGLPPVTAEAAGYPMPNARVVDEDESIPNPDYQDADNPVFSSGSVAMPAISSGHGEELDPESEAPRETGWV